MLSCMWIRSNIWIVGFFSLASAVPWMGPSQDEHDELLRYKAVVQSMNHWTHKHDLKRTKREEPSICYDELGCFEASGPFGYLDMLPSKPEEINTKFLMYPARNKKRQSGSAPTEVPFEKIDDAFEWAKGGFNMSLPTKILIHGFGSDCGYIWAYEIRSALMAVEEVNTICVDWSNGASLPNYVKASANTRLVGKQLSLLLRGLVEKNGLSLTNTHLIGFSLGAHIAGFAGADLGNLSRITGLDPAGPLFESQDTRARLDETDAAFVDVIHSNGENLILGGLGSSQPMGHVDFYPNGGRMQKGCSHLFVGAVTDIIWSSAVEGRSLCNHRRAYKFFIDSVSPRCHFPAFPCDSYDQFIAGKCFPCTEERKCGNMGYYADKSKGRGQLYLSTRDEEPFCAHQYLVQIESTSSSSTPVKSYGKIQVTLIGDSFLNETFTLSKKDDEEMKLGESISKIVVLHPVLSQPLKIEILYTAYSGWLSSGLTKWKMDKVLLMDSFGKISSFCKKALVLESGVPILLPLHPRDCGTTTTKENDTSMQQTENIHAAFIPYNRNENSLLDIEAESSRAFNSRVVKADPINKKNADSDGLIREIVEPILKTHSIKNARAHVQGKNKSTEITEPILGPTTLRSNNNSSNEKNKLKLAIEWQKEENGNEEKWKRQDESKALKEFDSDTNKSPQLPPNPNPIDSIVSTVQFLPRRLARMFEQAEKYARETILPLVSTYTPRFISDFIGTREEPKYVPLHYDEDEIQETASSLKVVGSEPRSVNEDSHIQKISKKKPHYEKIVSTTTENAEPIIAATDVSIPNSDKVFNIKVDYGGRQLNPPSSEENLVENPPLLETLATRIQSLPDNFVRLLSQVQNYTRTNILPFVQSYNPRQFTDLFWIRPKTNSTLSIQSFNTSDSRNLSMEWSITQDFTTELISENISSTSQMPHTTSTSTVVTETTTSLNSTLSVQSLDTSDSKSRNLSMEWSITQDFTTELISENISSTSQMPRTTSTSTIASKTTTSLPNIKKYHNHIQKIPKRGQKTNYKLPKPFTIIIDPNDLTTTTTAPSSTTSLKPGKFESYIQKIPKKKTFNKTPVYKLYPWIKDFKVGSKVLTAKNHLGHDMSFRISSDGRFVV
ncbi:unnamed protein product [Ceutorhynchus assimilis]|uniref:Lipase domain-containing protein n=1 Tax=Ceutorhynchus assimilis TaxID=467358 RepID=A0A9N9MWE5_9CUCU|nr:unnamed protein product [Ceutorhynchus assimilis]